MSFIRRYSTFPGNEVLTQIEGVIVIDTPPPATIAGVGAGGVACVVGEFADMAYGVKVDAATGDVTTNPQPVELFSPADLFNKLGGFDPTIGDTGEAGGSGFLALRNKRFRRLVAIPINLASSHGARIYRSLPTNKSATNPTPVVPITGAVVEAGREFKNGADRVHSAARAQFTASGAYAQGIDGDVTAAPAAPTQTFTSLLGDFLTAKNGGPVQKGDLLVLGQIGGALGLGSNARTYRVTADAISNTTIDVERLSGVSLTWVTAAALPWRIHSASDGDTGGQTATLDEEGFTIPARPLDATVAVDTSLLPTLVPPAATQSTWNPLSGLAMLTDGITGLVYTATIQAPNAENDATISALYVAAIDALLKDALPAREVGILFSARHEEVIRTKLKTHVLEASERGVGRVACISPELTTQATADAIADADPGVGANRAERVFYAWPGAKTFIPEAAGAAVATADGDSTEDGVLDIALDSWLASLLSNLAPELNPGQPNSPVPECMAGIAGYQRGVDGLDIGDYIQLRDKGICGLRLDRTAGPIFQSGVTSSLAPGEKNINRRRFADFVEDSLAGALVSFSKRPLTNALKDSAVGEVDAFMLGLLSPNNPAAQRIAGYLIDDVGGNTPELEALGIYVIIVKVRMTPTGDFITLQVECGASVRVTAQ